MKLHKRLIKASFTQRIIVRLLAFYIRFVWVTARVTIDMPDSARPYMSGKQNAIFAFWHGRMMLMPTLYPKERNMHVLISSHRDGLLISDVISRFNLQTVSGSTSKGSRAATLGLLRLLKKGDNVAITPDGPRGPGQIAAPGVASAARLSGKPIIPVSFAATRYKQMKSWDKFMIALPFSRIIFCVGEPLMVKKTMDGETARLQVESSLNALTEKADAALL